MSSLISVAKTCLGWVLVSLGILMGVFATAILDRQLDSRWLNQQSASGWFEILAATVFGFALMGGSVVATRNPRRAGFIFLSAAPLACAAAFLMGIDRLRHGTAVWYDWLEGSFVVALVALIVPGLFWLITDRFGWMPLLPAHESPSLKRKVVRLAASCSALLVLVVVGVVVLAILTRPFSIDCNKRAPISRLDPGQVVFVGRVVRTIGPCAFYGCMGGVAVVEEHFSGVRSKILLLSEGYFETGQRYLLDGVHYADGPVSRFLPIVGFNPCNHSARLQDAEVDLRILRDKTPHPGVRIIGRVSLHAKGWPAAPGRKVTITGPTGEITSVTDDQGVYDLPGLPPGHYEVHLEPPSAIHLRDSDCGSSGFELKSGDVGGCEMTVE